MTNTLLKPSELNQRLQRTLTLSSLQMGWNGILVEQHDYTPTPGKIEEIKLPALSDHWLILPMGHPTYLSQKSDYRWYESIFQEGDSLLVPSEQLSYWCCPGSEAVQTELNIHLQPKLVEQVAEASEINPARVSLVNHFGQQDLNLQQIAMLLLTEVKSGGMMGRLYVESLSQALIIHLLRHYSEDATIIAPENRSLTHIQLQQAIDYIHTHLSRDLSLAELANVVNITPTYFANLFKQAIGISPHQYVIQQRVEQAKVMLSKTDLAIADIALQVGFSSQSHLTQQFKRITGMTPKQVR
ncbi:AraC family transcriptional regulator [Chroococcidiopsis sp. SAG 2025]|uniref:AraC family transcriptional regulator n=1 Tax=Chroococcidiopsis sp. SAG 2025 TaxID=171389 RepID=UPI002936E6D3|nr:AraC family transcriptional regulator [Chroococcidiopsis sp. SAG 2025]